MDDYFNNQWIHGGSPIDMDHPRYKPLSSILAETFARYGRPIMIAETGIKDERRTPWFEYVSSEAARAAERGVPLEGLCLFPLLIIPAGTMTGHVKMVCFRLIPRYPGEASTNLSRWLSTRR